MQDILLFIQHHWALAAALLVILALLMVLELIKIKRSTRSISPAQTTHLMNHNKAIVVDLRSYDTFLGGHILNAISLPLTELKDKIKKIEKFKSQPIVIVCATDAESGNAAKALTEQGFDIQILSGGIRAWREADMPLVKG
ncbi:MAG: hypothetical protein ACD_60C00058G0001 [uncultured bacterium]|nr:MAG: hypothetical protein ACD_60C00058G0001 [uncultured bacterium]